MIFISGIHGVGKSYFCNKVKLLLNVDTYSSSKLIAERKKEGFPSNKFVSNIDDNQRHLLDAVDSLNTVSSEYLLDGHFCLLNDKKQIYRINQEIFRFLNPRAIILLTESPNIIAARRMERDSIQQDLESIKDFQNAEILYAKQISEWLNRSLYISNGSDDIENTLDFIQRNIRGI